MESVFENGDVVDLAADVEVQQSQILEQVVRRSTVASNSGMERPNLALSPTELPQRPVLRLESLARTPM